MSKVYQGMKVSDLETKIEPSWKDILLGLGAYLLAFVLGMKAVMTFSISKSNNSAEAGYNFGGTVALGIFTILIYRWGNRRLVRMSVKEAIEALRDKKTDNRRRAATALKRINWLPDNEDQRLDLIIASEEWEKATSLGEKGIQRVVDTLSWEGSFLPDKLKALAKSRKLSAVKPLIDILNSNISVGYKGEVVKVLKDLTGKDLRNYRQWFEWYTTEYGSANLGE